jgi:hypothetical protein
MPDWNPKDVACAALRFEGGAWPGLRSTAAWPGYRSGLKFGTRGSAVFVMIG